MIKPTETNVDTKFTDILDEVVAEFNAEYTRFKKRNQEIDDIIEGLIVEQPDNKAETIRLIDLALKKRKGAL